MAVGGSRADAARLLVPAYANPCCGDGPAMWSGLIALGGSRPQELGVVFNPASGPGGALVEVCRIRTTGCRHSGRPKRNCCRS